MPKSCDRFSNISAYGWQTYDPTPAHIPRLRPCINMSPFANCLNSRTTSVRYPRRYGNAESDPLSKILGRHEAPVCLHSAGPCSIRVVSPTFYLVPQDKLPFSGNHGSGPPLRAQHQVPCEALNTIAPAAILPLGRSNFLSRVRNVERERDFRKYCEYYLENIDFFRSWAFRKSILYYEDLINNPLSEIPRIASLLNIPNEATDDFIKNYDLHRSVCTGYKKSSGQLVFNTAGDIKKINYFSSLLSL